MNSQKTDHNTHQSNKIGIQLFNQGHLDEAIHLFVSKIVENCAEQCNNSLIQVLNEVII